LKTPIDQGAVAIGYDSRSGDCFEMEHVKQQRSVWKWLFGKPSGGEWRWVIAGAVLLALIPPAFFILFLFGGDGPPGGEFLVVFPVFLLLASAFCGVFGVASRLMLRRIVRAVFVVIEQTDKEYAKFAEQVEGQFERHGATRLISFTRRVPLAEVRRRSLSRLLVS
jgi:hypothetical protein